MPRVLGKIELCSTDLKFFIGQQGIEGKTLFDRYPALKNIISHNIDSKYQHFISEPVQDEKKITFYGKIYKETPRLLSELTESDREKYSIIKEETLAHYTKQLEDLTNSNKTSEEAEFLSKAIKFIDDRFIYCYDDMVVLGIWGMQMRKNIREDISEIRKNLVVRKSSEPVAPMQDESEHKESIFHTIKFNHGENGRIIGNASIDKLHNEVITNDDIPQIQTNEGYEFAGWSENPLDHKVSGNKEFTAQYNQVATPTAPPPWYKRFWDWLRTLFLGRGCLKWLLWLLLIILLLWLFFWLFRGCNNDIHFGAGGGEAISDNDDAWMRDDPNVGKDGGIYDPYKPYQPVPTPPENQDILPPYQGALPPVEENPEIIPGNPSILGNRLNILMENEDKSIIDLAKDFKEKYPYDNYKIIYYDDVVKRMQIMIPSNERNHLKEEIPRQFAPDYELFVFDESLFESNVLQFIGESTTSEKSWHLDAINAENAWEITMGSENITVAIVDNGFNLKHLGLKSKIVSPYNVWKRSTEIYPQKIDHGTHVAGIALGITNNSNGISGIAPNCKFMPIQVADENGLITTTTVLDGILFSLYQGADVVNVSLGAKFTSLSQLPEQEQQNLINNHFKEEERLWRRVMRIAAKHNSTLVIAAGNDNVLAGIDALQRPELFITVSAVDKNMKSLTKAQFSNYGSFTTVSAPGVGIYSTVGDNGYAAMDGTSMAAPIVAGAVALMKSINDSITTKRTICLLKNTGVETKGNIGKFIQLDQLLKKVKLNEQVDCSENPSTGDVQILLSWNNYNDLDLICTDPLGETIFYRNRLVSSGGQLEIDMNVEFPDSKSPIENIFWKPDSAPFGSYNVYLQYYKQHEPNIDETPYTVLIKYGNETEEYRGTINKNSEVKHIGTFRLGDLGGNPNSTNLINQIDKLEQQKDVLENELNRVNNELQKLRNRM